MGWEECFRQSFGGYSTWPGACSEVNKIGVVDIDRVGRNMIRNECGDVGHVFIGCANSNLKLQITKYNFFLITLDSVFEIFVYV